MIFLLCTAFREKNIIRRSSAFRTTNLRGATNTRFRQPIPTKSSRLSHRLYVRVRKRSTGNNTRPHAEKSKQVMIVRKDGRYSCEGTVLTPWLIVTSIRCFSKDS